MPRAQDRKIWNEDLVLACRSRLEMAIRSEDRRQFMWRDGAQKIEAVRKDIYTFSTGRVVNFPKGLKTTVYNLCMDVIHGRTEVLPAGYAEVTQGPQPQGNPFDRHPYLKTIKARGGAYAILMAFHHSTIKNLSKDEICSRAQPFCDSDMRENFHAGRMHGAWKSKDTLLSHGLINQTAGGAHYVNGVGFRGQKHSYTLTSDGEKFIEALLRKFPQGATAAAAQPLAPFSGGAFGTKRSPFRTPNRNRAGPTSAKMTRTKVLAEGDGEKLWGWIVSGAKVGDAMDFKVGKSRRKQLHDACDALEREVPGLKLNHSSTYETDTSNRRVLTVRLLQGPNGHGAELTASAKRRLFDGSLVGSNALDSDAYSPEAKRRRVDLPPSVACAQAALARQAMYESRMESSRKEPASATGDGFDDEEVKLAMELSREAAPKTSPAPEPEKEDRKPAAMSANDFDEDMRLALELSQATAPSQKAEERNRKPAATMDDDFDADQLKLAAELSQKFAPQAGKSEDLEEMERHAIAESIEMARKPAGRRDSDLYSSDSDDDLLNFTPTFGNSGQAARNVAAKKCEPAAKRSLFHDKSSNEPIELLSDDEQQDPTKSGREESIILATNGSRTETISLVKEDALRCRKRPPISQQEIIDIDDESQNGEEVIELLDDSQDSIAPFAAGTFNRSSMKTGPEHHHLTILIDNRERNRNVTPRHLRMELTRLVTNGDIKSVWPRKMPIGSVEEQALSLGDFAFDVECNCMGRKRMSVAVERKRVSDLVQRSSSGAHWRQFTRMRDNCTHSIFLIETDTRAATRFTAFGAQELEEWDPGCTMIDDERSIFLFFARALLSSCTANFIQTKDEISSLRAVAALGVMAASSAELRRKAAKAALPVSNCDKRLVDRLTAGGIPWKLARKVGDSLGSIRHLEHLYKECASDVCRSALLVPFVTETEFEGKENTAAGWSNAIFRVIQTAFAHATSCTSSTSTETEKRHVTVEVSEAKSNLFQAPKGESFYTLKLRKKNPLNLVLPTVVMRTTAGNLASHRLFVHLLQAKAMISLITSRIKDCGGDFVSLVKDVAGVVNSQCHHRTMAKGKDRRVLLLCGLTPALDAAAKKAGYRSETRALADMVMAELMLEHDLVVIQAVRLKNDTELILQLLSLACFHYHLLFQECEGP